MKDLTGNVENTSASIFSFDDLVKSPTPSLGGAKRRGNLMDIQPITRLLHFARNDKPGVWRLFASSSVLNW